MVNAARYHVEFQMWITIDAGTNRQVDAPGELVFRCFGEYCSSPSPG
jgi:hypothetical protein